MRNSGTAIKSNLLFQKEFPGQDPRAPEPLVPLHMGVEGIPL